MKRPVIVLLLLLSVPLFAGQPWVDGIDDEIMNSIFDARWAKADSMIDLQIAENPQHPKYYLLKAPLYFYTRYFSGGQFSNDSLLQLIATNSWKAIELAKEMEESVETNLYLGCGYGYLSRVQAMRRDLWDAYWSARDSRNYLENVLDEDPTVYDAYLGLAVMEYYADVQLNGFMGFVAWFGGISGDRQTGLEYFKNTAEKGKLFKNEAKFILANMYNFFENDLSMAFSYYTELNQQFPNNPFIANQMNQTRLIQLVDQKGVDFLETEKDSLASQYQITNAGPLNRLGYNFINQQRFDDAIKVFNVNIDLFPAVANCYDSIAECYLLMGDESMALKYTKIGLQKIPDDETINEQFRQQLKDILEERVEQLGGNAVTI